MVHFPFVQENLVQDLVLLTSVSIHYLQSHIAVLINLITNLFLLETNLHMPTQNLKTYSYHNLKNKSFLTCF